MESNVAENRLEVLQMYKLLQFVREGDKIQIEKLISMGVDDLINLTEPREGTGVLHLAAVSNDTDMANFLLSHGARPDVQDKCGRTPVMLAAQLGHDGMVALLAKKQASMKLLDVDGKGVLFYCLCPTKRHMRCLQTALGGLADVNNISLAGMPVFLQACERAHECQSMCISLLEGGADPGATNKVTGCTALMEAVKAGALELVRAILRRGANVNALNKKRLHAAHFAAERGSLETIQMLSGYSADLGVMTMEGNTALHYAASGGFADCCRFLAQRGCNPKLKNNEGLYPRQIAKDSGHKAAVKELKKAERIHGKMLKVGAVNMNEPWALILHDWSHENEEALRSAFASSSDYTVGMELVSWETFVSVLKDLQAPVNVNHLRALLLAHDRRREGLINVSEFLKGLKYLHKTYVLASYGPKKKNVGKSAKAKKNSKLNLPMPICTIPPQLIYRRVDGGPPHFMIESHQLHSDTRRFDRDHPPGHPIEDDSVWYIDEPERIYVNISTCVKTGDLESLRLAFSQKVPVDVKDRFYKTPLIHACACGNYEVAKYLLGRGADVNVGDQFNWTPLHHASHAGQLDIMELLMEAGAAVDAPALNGATPLMSAIESSRACCVDFLIKAGAKVNAENKSGQNCLEIARAYADFRIVDLLQDEIDALPKPKDIKRARASKRPVKPRSATQTKQKPDVSSTTPATSNSAMKKASKTGSVILHNAQITSGAVNRLDISFIPRAVRGKQPTTNQLMERRERRRQRFTSEVDFEDFLMPFSMNIQRKSVALQEITG